MMNYKCSGEGSLSGSGEAPGESRVFLSPPGAREGGTPGASQNRHMCHKMSRASRHIVTQLTEAV